MRWERLFWAPGQVCAAGIFIACTLGLILGGGALFHLGFPQEGFDGEPLGGG